MKHQHLEDAQGYCAIKQKVQEKRMKITELGQWWPFLPSLRSRHCWAMCVTPGDSCVWAARVRGMEHEASLHLTQKNKEMRCCLQLSVVEQFLPGIFILEQGFSWSPLPQPKVATLMVGISGSVTVGRGRMGLGDKCKQCSQSYHSGSALLLRLWREPEHGGSCS